MIKRLQRKFIAVSMCVVAAVLTVVMMAACAISYLNLNQEFDQKLSMLAANDGQFPAGLFDRKPGNPGVKPGEIERFGEWPQMSPESPYETRFFTVGLDADGRVLYTDTGFIAAVASEDAAEFAKEVYRSGRRKGYIDNYRYLMVEKGEGSLVVFLDCNRELSAYRSFVFTAAAVSAGSLLAVFLLLILFSKAAISPMAESYKKQKQFITDASHELKTPLTIISANNEVIELENGSSQWTDSIRNQVERLTVLTGNLVVLSRMDEEGEKLIFADFSLTDAVRETAQGFSVSARTKEIQYIVDAADGLICRGSEESIRQLVSLLCDNAVKYTNGGGEIRITLKSQGRKNVLTVYNTVDQMEKGRQDRLFERFYRADSSRNSGTGGNGIGLSLAKAIVEAHKGKISAVSEDGRSLTVKVML